MKAARFIDRIDDLLNPIVVKELRQAVKSRSVMSVLTLFLVVQLCILLVNLVFDESRGANTDVLHAGRQIFQILQGILLGTCMLLIPAYAGVRLATEHSETNVDLLFISTLRPRNIIAGKLQAAVVLIMLVFSACAPFMTFTYLLRGIDIPSIILILILDFLTVMLCTQAAIFIGSVPANPGLKLLLGLLGLGLLVMMFVYTVLASIGIMELGLGSLMDTVEFWLGAGSTALVVAAITGLLFVWTVAIVSPPSVNRALPVRLYLVAFWLATGGAAALLTRHFHEPPFLYVWAMVISGLLCIQILVSINEREQWGMRVARTIPRRWWLRGPAFLLYSGSAGGVLFAVLLFILTIASISLPFEYWVDLRSAPRAAREIEVGRRIALGLILAGLYIFDYSLLAVWLRNTLLSVSIKPIHTWVLALVVWALTFAIVYPLILLFQKDEYNMGHLNPWWEISNPFATIFTCVVEADRRGEAAAFRDDCFAFLIGWGVLMLLGCLPWMLRQAKRFHPPEKTTLAA